MTEQQELWGRRETMAMMLKKTQVYKPVLQVCYDIVNNPTFEPFILGCICLNGLTMAMIFYGEPTWYTNMIEAIDYLMVFIFSLELLLKVAAIGPHYYWSDSWNRFDAIIMFITWGDIITESVLPENVSSLTSKLRIFRLVRLVRLVKHEKILKRLLSAMYIALPSLCNALALITMIFFMYTILGVHQFATTAMNDDLNDHANFQNLFWAFLTLFRFCTGENWNGYMHSMLEDTEGCEENPTWNADWCIAPNTENCVPLNGCPNDIVVYLYFYSFTMVVSFIMINLFVGVILTSLDNFAEGDEEEPEEMMHRFLQRWGSDDFDPDCTGLLPIKKLIPFMRHLGPPVADPGKYVVVDTKELIDRILAMKIKVIEISFMNVAARVNAARGQNDSHDVKETKLHVYDVYRGLLNRQEQLAAELAALASRSPRNPLGEGEEAETAKEFDWEEEEEETAIDRYFASITSHSEASMPGLMPIDT